MLMAYGDSGQDDLPRGLLKCGLWVWIPALFLNREDIISQPEFPFVKNGENNNTFPGGSAGKESTCSIGDLSSIPELGSSPEERKGYPLKYSGPKNSMVCMYSPWSRKELDMTEQLSLTHSPSIYAKDWRDEFM